MTLKNSTLATDSGFRGRRVSARSPVQVLSTKTAYKGKVFNIRVDRIVEPGGVTAQREVVCHGGSAVVLPWIDQNHILLVRQFRYPAKQSLWELVAGGLEPNETPHRAAARELMEETGYSAGALTLLFKFYPSPGILSEKMHLFEAADLVRGTARPEPDERLQLKPFSITDLREMVRNRKIQDGKTLVGLLWLFANRL
jgi:ADP-ribose pyrophosphatase